MGTVIKHRAQLGPGESLKRQFLATLMINGKPVATINGDEENFTFESLPVVRKSARRQLAKYIQRSANALRRAGVPAPVMVGSYEIQQRAESGASIRFVRVEEGTL